MKHTKQVVLSASLVAASLVAASVGGCGSTSPDATLGAARPGDPDASTTPGTLGPVEPSGGDGGTATFGDGGVVAAPPAGCVGLQCQQHACAGGASTTVSGTVYDPAGKSPLYDVVVYVPNAPPAAIATGASCDSCSALYTGNPIASAVTDATGKFVLTHVPDGKNVPLVLQIGKWRKQMTIASVTACQDNPQPDKSLTLPKNHAEGDIPSIAISTGAADTLECLLRRVGLDASEYGPGATGAGRIHIFQGGDTGGGGLFGGHHHGGGTGAPNTSPAAPIASQALWDTADDLKKYDMLLLSCEGAETSNMNQQALFDYAAAGGRVFASHFHYAWFDTGPFGAANLATWSTGTNDMGDISATIVTTLPGGQVFPKGKALQQWLTTVNALTAGELPISEARHNADVGVANTASQAWITSDTNATPAGATEYFSFNTPIGAAAAQQCGRVVFSDLHVGAASQDYATDPSTTVPTGCANNDLSPQEKALEFMLFDLSSCVTPNDVPPQPPPVPQVK